MRIKEEQAMLARQKEEEERLPQQNWRQNLKHKTL